MGAIITTLFLLLILQNLYTLIYTLTMSAKRRTYLVALCLLVPNFALLYALTIDTAAFPEGHFLIGALQYFRGLPPVFFFALFLLISASSAFLLFRERKRVKNSITRGSIKESMDNLPMGVCFCTPDGMVLLSNKSMNKLCFDILGRELQDGEYFWQQILQKRTDTPSDVEENGERPIVRLKNGETWSFSRSGVAFYRKKAVQLLAINITELDELRHQLKEKNEKSVLLNRHLHQYSENLADIKAKEERLATKSALHSELGHILLATRKALSDEKVAIEPIFDGWRAHVAALLEGVGLQEKNVFDELAVAARDIGIELRLYGELPSQPRLKDLITGATIEALNNAARHAKATKLELFIEETEEAYVISMKNDGTPPAENISEGGGLGALREKTENFGGEMKIKTRPVFELKLILPKRRGE